MSRDEFFKRAFHLALDKGVALLKKVPLPDEEPEVNKQRPPGACHSEEEFLKLCTGCDACMAACPVNVIMIEDLERRDPVIYPETSPCIQCPGYPCIAACPTGALNKRNGTLARALST